MKANNPSTSILILAEDCTKKIKGWDRDPDSRRVKYFDIIAYILTLL